MPELRALDLYCGGGGAARGLVAAGFDVVGVDLYESPAYPGPVLVRDATELEPRDLEGYDLVWASPPCQRYSAATRVEDRGKHADLLGLTQDLLDRVDVPSIVENVPRAPMRRPAEGVVVALTGPALGLDLIERKRLFACRGFLPMVPPKRAARRFGRNAGAVCVLRNGSRSWLRRLGDAGIAVGAAPVLVKSHGPTITQTHEKGARKRYQAAAGAVTVAVEGPGVWVNGEGGLRRAGALQAGEAWLIDRHLHGPGVLRGKALARAALGVEDDLMTQKELGEAVPPAYAELLARQARP